MWTGDGWTRTRRQLGVLGFVAAFVIEAATSVDLPIWLYSLVGGLLGLDALADAIGRVKNGSR